ncbi:MAG: DUF4166 domain-containing protein [Homoserinimonas sp.]
MTASIFRLALGDDFERMHPQLQRYFDQPGGVRGSGVFDEAGSRLRWLAPVWRMLAGFGLLFPEYGTGVPFTVSIVPLSPGRVATSRRLQFPGAQRVMSDETHLVAGRLVDVHAGGRILVRMLPRVLEDGSLVMTAGATRLRVASVLLPVPTVPLSVSQRWDEARESFSIEVRLRLPLLGELFGYRGSFRVT